MGAEKHNTKGVGGILQLFDWNSRSKKKLFSSKSDFPEKPKQGKRSNKSLPATRYDSADEDESRPGSVKGSSDYSCASSVVDDDGYGVVRAPSVVARLMGLDSIPTSNCSEPSSTPFFDTQSLRSSQYQRKNLEYGRENQMYFSGNLVNKVSAESRCSFDSRIQKMPPCQPFEKFQSEILPPRSAKSIPITQHKLLSPIKSPGMFYTGDAAHIMEAAARIIESGPKATGKAKIPMVGSSSMPIRVRDLKERVRAAQERQERADIGSSSFSFKMKDKERADAALEDSSIGYPSQSFRMRDRQRIDAIQEPSSVGYSSGSFRLRDKERVDAIQEKTSNGYSSSSFRMRDKEKVDAVEERLERMRDKERVNAVEERLEVGYNSGSSRAREKERFEAPLKSSRVPSLSEKPVESNATKYLKGQAPSVNKSWNGSGDTVPFGADSELASSSNKGKSVSLAIQAKVNVQKREGMRLSSSRSVAVQKEQPEVKSQPNSVKNMHKRSSVNNASGVLRQNSQRQNCALDKDMPSKPLSFSSEGRKAISRDSTSTRHKMPSKVGAKTRKMNLDSKNSERDSLQSAKNVPRKKRNIDGGLHFERNGDDGQNKSMKSDTNTTMDRHAWIEDSRKKGMDVVSFTFTSPMTRPSSGFSSPSQMAQMTDGLFPKLPPDLESKFSSSQGLNVIGSDALSILLEQKLWELTTGFGSSNHDHLKFSSVPNLQPNNVCQDAGIATSKFHEKDQSSLHTTKFGSHFISGLQIDPRLPINDQKLEEMDEMDACSSNQAEAKILQDCHLPSPISILEGSFSSESCNSSRTADSGSTEDSKPCSSVQAREVIGLGSSKTSDPMEVDMDLSDSASSISPGIVAGKQATTLVATSSSSQSTAKWQLNYVKQILSNVDIMFENFSVGITPAFLTPQSFDQLENSRPWSVNNSNSSKLERKLYFDCVGESLDLRCRQFVGGGCEAWSKGMAMVKRKDQLAEVVYKEISGLKAMGDCMVDELVDKDMSSHHGKWTNFEVEEISLGVEIEDQILSSLVDEMVADILLR